MSVKGLRNRAAKEPNGELVSKRGSLEELTSADRKQGITFASHLSKLAF